MPPPDPVSASAAASSSSPSSLPLPAAHALLTSFNTFLTVSIHTILYYRNVYPKRTFLSARAYNLPVHQNRHPKVCAWVRDAVDAVAAQLASGSVSRVVVVIHASRPQPPPPPKKPGGGGGKSASSSSSANGGNSTDSGANSSKTGIDGPAVPPGAVLERWVFDVSNFPAWPGGAEAMRGFDDEKRTAEDEELIGEGAEAEDDNDDEEDPAALAHDGINWADVDEQLRGALRRLSHTGEEMGPLPDGCTFTVAVELRNKAEAPIGHPQPWIPSSPNLQTPSRTRPLAGRDASGANTTPIRSVEAGPLSLECWVEEGAAKSALLRPSVTPGVT